MFRFIANIIKAAFCVFLKIAAWPFAFILSLGRGRPIPPPPPVPVPEPEPDSIADPLRRMAQEIRRWACRRIRGVDYVPDVPHGILAWLHSLEEPHVRRLGQLRVDEIKRHLEAGHVGIEAQSSSSRRASAAASARSARNALSRQYRADSTHSHSLR